jgi:Spy/CpxP family protein refolding chaperone
MFEQKDAMRESRQALRDAMQSGAGKEELQALADKQGKQVSAMIMARAQMRDKINAILTEEQRAELKKMQQERRKRFDDDERGRW